MNKQEAKQYILKQWNISSGAKITEMLKRYFSMKDVQENLETPTQEDIALRIFNE